MLYIGILLGYCLVGVIIAFAVAAGHLIIAEKNGYKALDFWNDKGNGDMMRFILSDEDGTETSIELVISHILKWLTWPCFIVWMNREAFPTAYLLYDRYQPEYEPEEELD